MPGPKGQGQAKGMGTVCLTMHEETGVIGSTRLGGLRSWHLGVLACHLPLKWLRWRPPVSQGRLAERFICLKDP